jgi:hypothetical protein
MKTRHLFHTVEEVMNMAKNKGNKRKKEPTLQDLLKYEIATDLGLSEKVDREGWGGLTAQETGRIGGMMSGKKRGKGKQGEA